MSENGGVQNSSFVKVSFPTPDGPFGSEGIWCEPVLGDVYAVGNIPFFVYDLAMDDRITATRDYDGLLVYRGLHEKQGHATLRLLFEDWMPDEKHREVLAGIPLEHGEHYRYERGMAGLYSIDLMPAAIGSYGEVMEYLLDREQAGGVHVQEADRDCVPVERLRP